MLALALLALLAGQAAALDVLFVSTVSSPSHYIWVSALAAGLLERGHRLTELVIRPPASPHPNRTSYVYTQTYAEEHASCCSVFDVCVQQGRIYIGPANKDGSAMFKDRRYSLVGGPSVDPGLLHAHVDWTKQQGLDLDETLDYSLWQDLPFLYGFCEESTRMAVESQAYADLVRHLRRDKPHFDVFVVDYVFQEVLLGLNNLIGRKPVVAITAFNLPEDILALMGSPYFPSLLPYQGAGAHGGEPMGFAERLHNFYRWAVSKTYHHFMYLPFVERKLAELFPGSPPLAELQRDVAVSLVNTSPALHGSTPLLPSIIEVGGLQARPAKPLPADLEAWLNAEAAPHGFVFMSFGTNVKSAMLAKDRRDAILRAFGRIKQRVLWKYEEDDILDKLPPNVRVAKWLPQNDILAHPNIRCFVTHNGGLSSQEAAYHGVPLLGVPFLADQREYSLKTERMGLGRSVRYRGLTEAIFYEALSDVLENPKYGENMRRVRDALRDQKETPLQRAVWWVEHVARTRGAHHLRSPAQRLHWYQVWMLDVVAVLLAALALLAWLALSAVRLVAALLGLGASAPKAKSKAH